MIDDKLRSQLEAIRDGEIVDGHEVRPILCDAHRLVNEQIDQLFEERRLLEDATKNFAIGWEADLVERD